MSGKRIKNQRLNGITEARIRKQPAGVGDFQRLANDALVAFRIGRYVCRELPGGHQLGSRAQRLAHRAGLHRAGVAVGQDQGFDIEMCFVEAPVGCW